LLNELYELSKSLKYFGLLESTTHKNIGEAGKNECLLIELDKIGIPREIRLISVEEMKANPLWKHSKGNHNSFPAIRINKPLLRLTEAEKIDTEFWVKAELSDKIRCLKTLDADAINYKDSSIEISEWSLKELSCVLDSQVPELKALKRLISVFPTALNKKEFTKKLVDFLLEKASSANNANVVNFIKEMLVGKYDKKKGKYISECLTYYDVYEVDEYPNLVASPSTKQALVNLLNSKSDEVEHQIVTSPLSGLQCAGIEGNYPNPKIGGIGLTYLYSKNVDIECLDRYGLIGTKAFQAGYREVNEMNDAITFLVDPSREKKTWKNIEKGKVLLAYLPDDPKNNALIADVLALEMDDKEELEATFEELCQQVLGSISDIVNKNPNSKVNVMIIETLDPGRKQITYTNQLTAERLRRNLLMWSDAAKNHPDISFSTISSKKHSDKKFTVLRPITPGTKDISELMQIKDVQSGLLESKTHKAVMWQDIFKLYMPSNDIEMNDYEFLYNFLSNAVERTTKLLGNAGNQKTLKRGQASSIIPYKEAKKAILTVSLISVLLWRLDVRKENYMLEVPFNVGQFLQLADMLHKEYCINVRNSGNKEAPLPSQLMGNEMLTIACENPVEGLNRLRERMKIYLAWAQTATGKDSGLAKWILHKYGEVSAKIAAYDLPDQFNAKEQAQVLLGYLANIPYEKQNKDN